MRAATLVCLSALVGCSGAATPPAPVAEITNVQDVDSPFQLGVLDEVNDGQKLHVLAQVTPKVAWNSPNLAVRLAGMRDGQELASAVEPVMSGSTGLSAGQPTQIALTVPAEGITDYQLSLVWGKEAVESKVKAQRLLLSLERLSVEALPCVTEPCETNYVVSAQLKNNGTAVITQALLGVGFIWSGKGDHSVSDSKPEYEDEVEIKNLTLKPGQVQPVRLTVDRMVKIGPQGGLRPVVRLISFS